MEVGELTTQETITNSGRLVILHFVFFLEKGTIYITYLSAWIVLENLFPYFITYSLLSC